MSEPQNAATPTDLIPLEFSKRGDNTFYHHCETYQGRSSYAVCLHTIDAIERDPSNTLRLHCAESIQQGKCPAVQMRAAEVAAGRAIHFISREQRHAEAEAMAGNGLEIRYGRRSASSVQPPLSSRNYEMRQAAAATQPIPAEKPTRVAAEKGTGLDASLMGRNLITETINAVIGGKSE